MHCSWSRRVSGSTCCGRSWQNLLNPMVQSDSLRNRTWASFKFIIRIIFWLRSLPCCVRTVMKYFSRDTYDWCHLFQRRLLQQKFVQGSGHQLVSPIQNAPFCWTLISLIDNTFSFGWCQTFHQCCEYCSGFSRWPGQSTFGPHYSFSQAGWRWEGCTGCCRCLRIRTWNWYISLYISSKVSRGYFRHSFLITEVLYYCYR